VGTQIAEDAPVDDGADERVVEERGADAYRCGAGDEEFNGVFGAGDAPLADHRDAVWLADLIDLVDLQHSDGFDGRPGKTSLVVADYRLAGPDVDCHAHQRVDDGEGIAAGRDAAPGIFSDVGLVG
jgi:hypothetical protein